MFSGDNQSIIYHFKRAILVTLILVLLLDEALILLTCRILDEEETHPNIGRYSTMMEPQKIRWHWE